MDFKSISQLKSLLNENKISVKEIASAPDVSYIPEDSIKVLVKSPDPEINPAIPVPAIPLERISAYVSDSRALITLNDLRERLR